MRSHHRSQIPTQIPAPEGSRTSPNSVALLVAIVVLGLATIITLVALRLITVPQNQPDSHAQNATLISDPILSFLVVVALATLAALFAVAAIVTRALRQLHRERDSAALAQENRAVALLNVQRSLDAVLKVTTTMALLPNIEHILQIAVKSIFSNINLPRGSTATIRVCAETPNGDDSLSSFILDKDNKVVEITDTSAAPIRQPPELNLANRRVVHHSHGIDMSFGRQNRSHGSISLVATAAISLHPGQEHFLRSLATSVGVMIDNLRQRQRIRNMTQLEVEIETAAAIQRTLFSELPAIPNVILQPAYRPASQVAGDWYAAHWDALNNQALFCVGDATGHGIAPALVTATVAGAFSAVQDALSSGHLPNLKIDERLRMTVELLDATLRRSAQGKICMTCLVFGFSPTTGQGALINRGHRQLIRLSADGEVQVLVATGNILGDSLDMKFETRSLALQPGDTLFAYSDGLLENEGPNGETFSSRALRQTMKAAPPERQNLVAHILENADLIWKGCPAGDDITMLSATWTGQRQK